MIEEAKSVFSDDKKLEETLRGIEWQLLVADNGSTDGSVEIAKNAGAEVLIVNRRGYGAALDAGIRAATGDWVVFCDADATYDPADAPKLLSKAIETQADLVLGSRLRGKIDEGAMPWMHRWIGTPVLTFLIRTLFGTQISDCNSGIRCIRKSSYLRNHHSPSGMEFASAQLVQAAKDGWKMVEVPAHLRVGPKGRIPHLKRWRDGMRHLLVILAAAPGSFWGLGISALALSVGIILPSFWGTIQITENVGIFGPHTQAIGTIIGFYGAICVNLALLLYARYGSLTQNEAGLHTPKLVRYLLDLPEGVLFWGLVSLSGGVGLGVAWLFWMWLRSAMGALHQIHWALGLVYFAVVPLSLGVGVFQAHLQKRVRAQRVTSSEDT